MTFNGYHHIGLLVRDMEASLRFYTDGLGGTETFSFPMGDSGKTIHMVDLGGNAVVELIPRGAEEAESHARWAHIALRTDDARAAYAKALEAGALSRTEPVDKHREGAAPTCNAFVLGPDGEVIELFEVK